MTQEEAFPPTDESAATDAAHVVDLAVVGAGAAGLMTAICAARSGPGLSIALIESQRKPGAKILVSGGGRCNVTNRVVGASDFHGNRRIIDRVLRRFGAEDAVRFFAGLDVELKHEPEFDKLFPVSDSARTVLAALLDECERLGVTLVKPFRVEHVEGTDPFVLTGPAGALRCRRLVLATGGRALPKSGSDGRGYDFATHFGHRIGNTVPALVPLVLEPHPLAGLEGIAVPAEIAVWDDGRCVDRVRGPALITHQGLSGPAPMDASRHFSVAAAEGRAVRMTLCFTPGRTPEEVDREWIDAARAWGRRPLTSLLQRGLPGRLVDRLLRLAELDPAAPLSQLGKAKRKALRRVVTALELPVTGTRGFRFAEVTAGGVPLSEVNPATMESRKQPGLHLVGEILDVDGRIGGFNFQWAWSTGHLAGTAAAQALA